MLLIDKSVLRLNSWLSDFPDSDLWVIARDTAIANMFWNHLKKHVNYNKKVLFLNEKQIDGLNPSKAIILLCYKWYFNPVSETPVFKRYLKLAKATLQFGELPAEQHEEGD